MTKSWSPQQKGIFDFFREGRGNLVVRARAGSGKTTTILEACKHVPAGGKTLLAAFNKRIAVELQGRVGDLVGVEAKTLHSLGLAFIRRMWRDVVIEKDVDYARARQAAGTDAPDEIVEMVEKLAGLLKNMDPFTKDTEEAAEIGEEFDIDPGEDWEEEGWTLHRVAQIAIKARDLAKERDSKNRVSFDDMIFIPIANNFVRAWYTLVVVDEAQDMNYSQLLLAQKACKREGRIVVVGDDRQAIYGFRGADSDGIDRLKQELSARELGLTVTYRCGKKIVAVAQKLVPDFSAGPSNPDGVVDACSIDKLIDEAQPSDFILSRTNAPLMSVCLRLLKKGKRARIEGRDVAAGLRAIVKGMKARSVPQFIQKVGAWRERQEQRATKIRKASTRTAKLDVIRDQAEMLISMAEGCASVDEILVRTETLFGDSSNGNPADSIVCSSVHRSKGLETDRVFVLMDTIRADDTEENNIAYVAYTRAKARLTMVRK